MTLTIRPMQATDVPAMLMVQAHCYDAAMNEPGEVFLARFAACPDTAWVALDAHGQVGAYLVAYRSCLGKVTPLGHAFEHAAHADVLYLHDLAIGMTLRGKGVAQQLVQHARQHAQGSGLQGLSLVSVNDTVAFWQRMGLKVVPVEGEALLALATYPQPAHHMQCR